MVAKSHCKFLDGLRARLREFRDANGANVTITFALATVPVIGFVGASIDYGHASSVRTAMQAASDTTALMLAKSASSLTDAQVQAKGAEYFKALFNRPEATNLKLDINYTTTGGSQITVSATADVKTDFMQVMGFDKLKIATTSQAKWGNTKLRVALVLDITLSMNSDGKMDALKTATKNLLNQLKSAAAKDGDVYVSIIPFNKDVNVGAGNYNASWIYWDDAQKTDQTSWDALNGKCNKGSAKTRPACLAQASCSIDGKTTQSTCTAGVCSISGYTTKKNCEAAGVCSKSQYTTESKCKNNSGKWSTGVWTVGEWNPPAWTPNNHSTWTGCVMDRGNPSGPHASNYDTDVTAPTTSTPATLYAAEQYKDCGAAVSGLSYNWSSMTSLVNNLTPTGSTNQGVGLQLGWMSLVGGGPFTAPAKDASFQYSEVIILMSDGLNTENRWNPFSQNSTTQDKIDAREAMTCTNAKKAGITIYAVQVNTTNDPTQSVLKNCASDSGKFFELKKANELVATFNSIGTALSNLRIAQ